MRHESYEMVIDVRDTNITFEKMYEKEYAPMEYIDEIKAANLLLIPDEFTDEGKVIFPENTRDFFEFIQEESTDDIVADIVASDDNFQRIELHSAVINVTTILVEFVVFPIATGLITNYLYDLVKKHHRKTNETSAKVNIIVEDTLYGKSKKIMYEGPVEGIKETLDKAAEGLFEND